MIRYTKCPGCGSEQKVKSDAATRGDLQMKVGDEMKMNCNNCGKMANVHINDIVAKTDNRIVFGAVVLTLIVTAFLWYYFGAIGTITITLPILFWKQQEMVVSSFNRYKIKRR